MGGQTGSPMGGASTPQVNPGIQANMGPGSMGATGGFDLSKLFMGNTPTSGGGMPSAPLPQITAPARPPMPTMPVRTPMPQATQAQNPFWYMSDGRWTQASSMTPEEAQSANRSLFMNNRERGRGGR